MAFRKKAAFILKMNPDILIVPECENPERLLFPKDTKKPDSAFWAGVNPHKGIGIFAYNNFSFKIDKNYTEEIKYVIPLIVKAPGKNSACWLSGPITLKIRMAAMWNRSGKAYNTTKS